MRNAHCSTWSMARKLKIMENEKHTCRNWNLARNSENREKLEIHSVGTGLCREKGKPWKMRRKNCMTWNKAINSEIVKTEKYMMQNLEYGEKIEKHGK